MIITPEEFPERQAEAGDSDTLADGQRMDCARWMEGAGRFAIEVKGGVYNLSTDSDRWHLDTSGRDIEVKSGPLPQAEDAGMGLHSATGGSTH